MKINRENVLTLITTIPNDSLTNQEIIKNSLISFNKATKIKGIKGIVVYNKNYYNKNLLDFLSNNSNILVIENENETSKKIQKFNLAKNSVKTKYFSSFDSDDLIIIKNLPELIRNLWERNESILLNTIYVPGNKFDSVNHLVEVKGSNILSTSKTIYKSDLIFNEDIHKNNESFWEDIYRPSLLKKINKIRRIDIPFYLYSMTSEVSSSHRKTKKLTSHEINIGKLILSNLEKISAKTASAKKYINFMRKNINHHLKTQKWNTQFNYEVLNKEEKLEMFKWHNEITNKTISFDEHKTNLIRLTKNFNLLMDEYNIKPILWAGTALGWARNKKMIPWDDDVDYALPLNEIKKITKLLQNNKIYSVTDSLTKKDSVNLFKFYENNKNEQLIEKNNLIGFTKPFIDIFPLYKVTLFKLIFGTKLWKLTKIYFNYNRKNYAKWFGRSKISKFHDHIFSNYFFNKIFIKLMRKKDFSLISKNRYIIYTIDGKKIFLKYSNANLTRTNFENIETWVFSKIKEFLLTKYGANSIDTLPPIKDQKTSHISTSLTYSIEPRKKKEKKLLTVLVTIYQSKEEHLKRILKSISEVSKLKVINECEFIFINDNPDSNWEKEYIEKNINNNIDFKYVQNKMNIMKASSIFKGAFLAKGKYIKTFDPDDEINVNNFSKFIELLRTENKNIILNNFSNIRPTGEVKIRDIENWGWPGNYSQTFSKKILIKIFKNYDWKNLNYAEDYLILVIAIFHSKKSTLYSKVNIYNRYLGEGMSSFLWTKNYETEIKKYNSHLFKVLDVVNKLSYDKKFNKVNKTYGLTSSFLKSIYTQFIDSSENKEKTIIDISETHNPILLERINWKKMKNKFI